MSDIFDHGLDAWEDRISGRTYDDGAYEPGFVPDPLYYHMKINYKLLGETETLLNIEVSELPIWIPKKIVKKMEDKTMFVHVAIFKSIVTKAIEIAKQKTSR